MTVTLNPTTITYTVYTVNKTTAFNATIESPAPTAGDTISSSANSTIVTSAGSQTHVGSDMIITGPLTAAPTPPLATAVTTIKSTTSEHTASAAYSVLTLKSGTEACDCAGGLWKYGLVVFISVVIALV